MIFSPPIQHLLWISFKLQIKVTTRGMKAIRVMMRPMKAMKTIRVIMRATKAIRVMTYTIAMMVTNQTTFMNLKKQHNFAFLFELKF